MRRIPQGQGYALSNSTGRAGDYSRFIGKIVFYVHPFTSLHNKSILVYCVFFMPR